MTNNTAISLKETLSLISFSFGVFGVLLTLGIDSGQSTLLTLCVFIALTALSLQIKLIESNKSKYSLLIGNSGRELYDAIKASEKTIVLTAFSKDQPTQEYIDLLLRKLEDGISVTRFVPLGAKQSNDYSWLRSFDGKKHYVEIEAEKSELPFDTYIFDDKLTKIYFPFGIEHEHFKNGLEFNDVNVASMFKTALHKLCG
ncbi:MAG: hypothetical protein ACXWE9_05660 [Methylobacter sp.]